VIVGRGFLISPRLKDENLMPFFLRLTFELVGQSPRLRMPRVGVGCRQGAELKGAGIETVPRGFRGCSRRHCSIPAADVIALPSRVKGVAFDKWPSVCNGMAG
jgi:hypothetical protein